MAKEHIERSEALQLVFDACACCMDACEIDGEDAMCDRCAIEGIKLCLRDMPAADVVEVVRCKDCQYWEQATPNSGNCNRALEITAYANDFCSYGERRAEDA